MRSWRHYFGLLTLDPGSNLGFFLSLDADLFFFFFFEEWSLDFVLSTFTAGLLVELGASDLAETFSWLLPTLSTSLIGFSPFSAFSDLPGMSADRRITQFITQNNLCRIINFRQRRTITRSQKPANTTSVTFSDISALLVMFLAFVFLSHDLIRISNYLETLKTCTESPQLF